MLKWSLALALSSCIASSACGDPAVTFSLSSSRSGMTVAPGAAIDWTIAFSVSAGDNLGAGLVSVDLQQQPTNPLLFDLPIAAYIPLEMANFNRPAGLCNPGEGGSPSGYFGLRRGPAGARNLVQIGGAQNTFGQAFLAGAGVGENANVMVGVGQSGPQVLASGSFAAPASCGQYSFTLANPIASVILAHNNPPAISLVARAVTNLSPLTISFTVALTGDLNLDAHVDIVDLTQLLAGFGTTSGATLAQGDVTGDGAVNLEDLTMLLASFGATCP